MSVTASPTRLRVQSIDVLRGIVMVIMALDHVRDFFHKVESAGTGLAMDPTNLATTTPFLFFTRWITHFCAPAFVFLAGTSAYMMSQRRTKSELSTFLIKRGIYLALLEVVIMSLIWTFNPAYNNVLLGVIWVIGISMILLGLAVRLPFKVILVLGIIILLGHNLLDFPQTGAELKGNFWADLFLFSGFAFHSVSPSHAIVVVYAILPWTGVIMLGYCFGWLYREGADPSARKKMLKRLGIAVIVFFILLRILNVYGDPAPWSEQPRGTVFSFLSFLNLTKYPPSLLYICMTLGPAILILAYLENIQNRFTNVMNIYGRVPLFYYILHLILIHTMVVIVFFVSGFPTTSITEPNLLLFFRPPDFGFPLWGVYLVWFFVVLVIYPFCKKYNRYKSTHKQWWLSYI